MFFKTRARCAQSKSNKKRQKELECEIKLQITN